MKMGSINHWVKKEQERVEDGSLFARILSSFFIQFMKMAKEKGEKINKNTEIFSVESSHYTSKPCLKFYVHVNNKIFYQNDSFTVYLSAV
jgi:hypothetical protein